MNLAARRHAVVLGLLLAAPFGARTAAADDKGVTASSGLAVYADSDATTVITPHVEAAWADRGASLHAGWLADVISSASVDVVTAATSRIRDMRQEVSVGGGYESGKKGFDAGYSFSWENDTISHTASVGGSATWNNNLETRLHYTFNWTSLGRATEPREEWRSMMVHGIEAAILHPLGPRASAEVVLSGYYSTGYQANPYRKVPVSASGLLSGALWFDEVVPDTRLRLAATGRLRGALSRRVVGSAEYRLYHDTWGLTAHTAELRLVTDVWRHLTFEVRERFHIQGASDLYRTLYTQPHEYMTRDRRQSAFLANAAGLAAAYDWQTKRAHLSMRLSCDGVTSDFEHFLAPAAGGGLQPLGWVVAVVSQLALEAEF